MITAEASASGSSNSQTQKSLKPKPKITKKLVNNDIACTNKLKDAPTVQRRKIKKKIVKVSKVTDNNNNQDTQALHEDGLKQKDVIIIGDHSKGNCLNSERRKKILIGSQRIKNGNNKDCQPQDLNTEESKEKNVISGDGCGNNHENLKRKKRIVTRSKKMDHSNDKEGFHNLNREDSKQKNVICADKSKMTPENLSTNVQYNDKNRENSSVSENKQIKHQNNQKNKEKLSGLVGNEQMHSKEEENQRLKEEPNDKRNKKLGGMIFMCSAKTKSDCFRYHVMGVSTNKKDLVYNVKPGLKLFLYDTDVKLLYGIYKASSPGGIKLEPAAFDGSFPVQVRFDIYRDCYPIHESVFRRAIKENYNWKKKFDQELSVQQVDKLMKLFSSAEINLRAPPIYATQATSVDTREAQKREINYLAHHRIESLGRDPLSYDESRRYDLHLREKDEQLPYKAAPSTKREKSPGRLFLSEKDYRTYGLQRERRNVSPYRSHVTSTLEPDLRAQEPLPVRPGSTYGMHEKGYETSFGPFPTQEPHPLASMASSSTAAIVDSYLKVPYYGSSLGKYQLPLRKEEVTLGSYSLGGMEATYRSETSYLPRREIYPIQSNQYLTEGNNLARRENDDKGSLYSTYASNALLEYSRTRPETLLPSVSAQYSFAGPGRRYP